MMQTGRAERCPRGGRRRARQAAQSARGQGRGLGLALNPACPAHLRTP